MIDFDHKCKNCSLLMYLGYDCLTTKEYKNLKYTHIKGESNIQIQVV